MKRINTPNLYKRDFRTYNTPQLKTRTEKESIEKTNQIHIKGIRGRTIAPSNPESEVLCEEKRKKEKTKEAEKEKKKGIGPLFIRAF
jgi:hypothetical protein